MVEHDLTIRGASWSQASQTTPLIMQMKDEDFPARFLVDVLTQSANPAGQVPAISSAAIVVASGVTNSSTQPTSLQPPPLLLYQPVQRIINVAMMQIACNTVTFPRLDPTRVVSAGLVVRRLVRVAGPNGTTFDDPTQLAAWMKNAQGQWNWIKLTSLTEDLDPDPTLREPLQSGDPVTDSALAAMALGTAYTESTTPAFAAPPATCAAINSTVLYGMIPTASSEVCDTAPGPPVISNSDLLSALPGMLRSAQSPIKSPNVPIMGATIDSRWMNNDFLSVAYPPTPPPATTSTTTTTTPPPQLPVPDPRIADIQNFTLAVTLLQTVFNVFDGSGLGEAVIAILNRHKVTFDPSVTPRTQLMGEFYRNATTVLLGTSSAYGATGTTAAPTLVMPTAWDWLNNTDQSDLLSALLAKNAANSTTMVSPMGRFQDSTRIYQLRMFARVKAETPNCPTELVWSCYSQPFNIAAWFETGVRAHPPVPLPDPTAAYMQNAKPNCSFQVPGNLMGAMQGTTLSGLMKGTGGGGGLSLGWICGFNIPLITICAFFVLNIFLSLLNIIFFWLPFIKICIPVPVPSQPDE
jgi:hypothetical protein